MKILKKNILLLLLLALLIFPAIVFIGNNPASAQNSSDNSILGNLGKVGEEGAGFAKADETSVAKIAGTIVNISLSFLGIIFVVLIIYAGFMWMTAQGDESKVSKAQTIIKNCIIGLIVLTSAWAIYNIVKQII